MEFMKLTLKVIDEVITKYMDYFNNEGENWSYDTASKRIHQIFSMENSVCLVAVVDGEIIGFLMGYYLFFSDKIGFYLEEILIFKKYQNQGYGSRFIEYLKDLLRLKGCSWINLFSLHDELHEHFYKKNDFETDYDFLFKRLDL